MNQDDTLCDEIEDATEEDTPYELWVINKKVKTKMENIKQNIVKDTGIVLTVLTTLKISQNLKLNLVYLRKVRGWATLPEQIEKTKLLMASTILLLQIQLTMVLCQKSHNLTNQAQQKLYNIEGLMPSFLLTNKIK